MAISLESLQYIVNHVVLPPQLPSSPELTLVIQRAEQDLFRLVLQAVQQLHRHGASHEDQAWNVLERTLQRWATITAGGSLSTELLNEWLADTSVDDVVSLIIKAQNAALIIRIGNDGATFESFELSPQSESVIECKASLRRSFPAGAVFVRKSVFDNTGFREELLRILRKLDVEVVEDMAAKSTKAGDTVTEVRDSVHPALVTEMLMITLAALGQAVTVPQVDKRVRDDVVWDNSLLPWRRSPLWLALRVTLQTTLSHMLSAHKAYAAYKNLMLLLLTKILELSLASELPLDLCSVIQAKISRRGFKLGADMLYSVGHNALLVGNLFKSRSEDQWQNIQASEAAIKVEIDVSSLEQDTTMTLTSCGPYLDSVLESTHHACANFAEFSPQCPKLVTFQQDQLPVLHNHTSENDRIFALAELETWVALHLPAWTAIAKENPVDDQCCRLTLLSIKYKRQATLAYADSPEQRSMMLLTLAELWLALDTVIVQIIPLLREFHPELSERLFQPLLLPRRVDMARLKTIENHVARREQDSTPRHLSIFANPSDDQTHCFASRYFELSAKHKKLRKEIEADATEQRTRKKTEWETKQRTFDDIEAKAANLSCATVLDNFGGQTHDHRCRKCKLEDEARAMRIDIHEWPLPENETQCRAAVVELNCPPAFAAWRELTWILIQDLGRSTVVRGDLPATTLSGYSGLQIYKGQYTSRLTLASKVKSSTKAHYRKVEFPTDLSQIYRRNGLRYNYFDTELRAWISNQVDPVNFSSHCISKLPNGPYQNLQYTVDSTAHHQSTVIADQSSCSRDITLHELIAFGSLRSDGEGTQWLNILRELGAKNLTLNTEAVCILVTQAATQAGSKGDTELRLAHSIFEDSQFCATLLAKVYSLLATIELNWRSEHTMRLVIVITLRTFSLTKHSECCGSALKILHKCRQILSSWMKDLEKLLENTIAGDRVQTLQQTLLRVGLLGKKTYDTDGCRIDMVMESAEDVRHWVIFSIIVHDNSPGSKNDLPTDLRRMLLNEKKLSYAIGTRMYALAANGDNQGIDQAIRSVWCDFRPSSTPWNSLQGLSERWLQKSTSSADGQDSQLVSYNILEGELLVDGRPLGRLPKEYIHSDLYIRLFGSQIFPVFSSTMPGMLYMTAREVEGCQLHFGKRGEYIAIRMRKMNQVWEAVPHEKLRGDFPTTFVDEYLHWLDISMRILEFRAFGKLFEPSAEWLLHYNAGTASFLNRDNRKLVDVRSQTACSVASVFAPLEIPSQIHVTSSNESRVDITLPRLGLRFFLNENGHLECRELRKIVDPDQFIGTFLGLRSKMVLCEEGGHSQHLERIVIVPAGKVDMWRHDAHVAVSVSSDDKNVHVFRYQVDSVLGRLRDDGTLCSRLYQAYLHAITSHMLPDPLTGCIGTEQALLIINSQIKQTWKPLAEDEATLLDLLSAMTPHRRVYPKHLRVMQQVKWSPYLSFLSQHDDFSPLCEQLLSSGNRFSVFYPATELRLFSLEPRGDLHLMQRARLRNSTFRRSQSAVNLDVHVDDIVYLSRDNMPITERGKRSYQIAALIALWPSTIESTRTLYVDLKQLGIVSGFGKDFVLARPLVDLLQTALATSWAPLCNLCRRSTAQSDRYKLLFTFAIIAYGQGTESLNDLRTILAFAFLTGLQALPIPSTHKTYDLRIGSSPQEKSLTSLIQKHANNYVVSRPQLTKAQRRQELASHNAQVQTQAVAVAQSYSRQWPCTTLSIVAITAPLLNIEQVHASMVSHFELLTRNAHLKVYLEEVQAVLDTANKASQIPTSPQQWQDITPSTRTYSQCVLPDIALLLSDKPPEITNENFQSQLRITRPASSPVEDQNLASLLSSLIVDSKESRPNKLRRSYKEDLKGSFAAFQEHRELTQPNEIPYDIATIRSHCDETYNQLHKLCKRIDGAIQPSNPLAILLQLGGFWPRLTITGLLGLLASTNRTSVNEQWSDCLLGLGKAVTIHQRARRLVLAAEKGNISNFVAEAENIGCIGWDPKLLPDWLLVQIENDFLIRPIQARVAYEMMKPKSSANILTQLNMGEGKSSVIVPLVATALANGEQLSRVLVLKSLTRQMMDTLTRRLSGLVGRQVYFLPFSRKTPIEGTVLPQMQALYEECLERRGILLTQPEFLLSFRLMGIERLTAGNLHLSTKLLETQKWLDAKARDLLDESDEILDVKFQLIYTIGNQRSMDGQPERWLLTQSLLDLVDKHATTMASRYPKEIEVKKRSNAAFPTIRLMSPDVGRALVSRVLADVVDSKLPGLNLENWDLADTEVLRRFLQDVDIGCDDCSTVTDRCSSDPSLIKKVLLIRGLVAHGILLYILSAKRLTDSQMRNSFELLQKTDDPSSEYRNWTQRANALPSALRDWNAVNLEDEQQCYGILFPALRYSKKVADFYMANIVFPREGKEFDKKLSTSGWDIPSKLGSRLTTGFSGTNDNRFLLPTSISQQDLPELRHTSGKVLYYVLRPQNLRYDCAKDPNGRQLSAEGLLRYITQLDTQARVLIDVGAQVLETRNDDVVKDWLRFADDVDAGVFFDDDDKVMVVGKGTGKVEPLATSSFSGRLDRCLVYLDEVHTRGTDLKLPWDARAIVTLGPHLTKDRLVQACMRLRQLAHGQSFLFIAPPEVHRNILTVTGKSDCNKLDGYDVMKWALVQSCLHIEKSEPLQIIQGLSYHRRQSAAQQYPNAELQVGHRGGKTAAELFIETEEQSLHDLYAPTPMKAQNRDSLLQVSARGSSPEVQALLHRWSQIDPSTVDGANVQEEHEREVAHEVEQETEIQRPPPAKPLKECVDIKLEGYIQTGSTEILNRFSRADDVIVGKSSAYTLAGPDQFWKDIHVSEGFTSTVEKPGSGFYDDYTRPVNWILTCKSECPATALLVISPYEVNQLLSVIIDPASAVILHSYEPRVTRTMSSVDSSISTPFTQATENWLNLSPILRRQLHLFAGQLYINTYEEYLELRMAPHSIMVNMSFLKEWIGIRRRGQQYSQTHIGRMISGWNLQEEDFGW